MALVTAGVPASGPAGLQFAREGAKVVIAARGSDRSEAVVRQIEALGSAGLFTRTDGTKRVDIEALVEGGRIHIGVHHLGLSHHIHAYALLHVVDGSCFGKADDSEFCGSIWGVAHIARFESIDGRDVHNRVFALPQHGRDLVLHAQPDAFEVDVHHLIPLRLPSISATGTITGPVMPALLTAQSNLPNLARAPELIQSLINRYSAQNRMGDAEETAETITWLCPDAARIVNGAVLPVDGGDTARLY